MDPSIEKTTNRVIDTKNKPSIHVNMNNSIQNKKKNFLPIESQSIDTKKINTSNDLSILSPNIISSKSLNSLSNNSNKKKSYMSDDDFQLDNYNKKNEDPSIKSIKVISPQQNQESINDDQEITKKQLIKQLFKDIRFVSSGDYRYPSGHLLTKSDIKNKIISRGGLLCDHISRSTDFLLTSHEDWNENTKVKRTIIEAKKLNIPSLCMRIIDECIESDIFFKDFIKTIPIYSDLIISNSGYKPIKKRKREDGFIRDYYSGKLITSISVKGKNIEFDIYDTKTILITMIENLDVNSWDQLLDIIKLNYNILPKKILPDYLLLHWKLIKNVDHWIWSREIRISNYDYSIEKQNDIFKTIQQCRELIGFLSEKECYYNLNESIPNHPIDLKFWYDEYLKNNITSNSNTSNNSSNNLSNNTSDNLKNNISNNNKNLSSSILENNNTISSVEANSSNSFNIENNEIINQFLKYQLENIHEEAFERRLQILESVYKFNNLYRDNNSELSKKIDKWIEEIFINTMKIIIENENSTNQTQKDSLISSL